ncbi:MAG: hypothetical protein ACNA7O_05065 [Rhodobacterales bacterium]
MNAIIFTHFAAPEGASPLELAVDRLAAWLDGERDTLGRVLAQVGRSHAASALEALDQLHLEPESTAEDLRNFLEDAQVFAEVLLEAVRAIPIRCRLETAYGLPGPAAFDAHVRWSGARLEDILATLSRALAA